MNNFIYSMNNYELLARILLYIFLKKQITIKTVFIMKTIFDTKKNDKN